MRRIPRHESHCSAHLPSTHTIKINGSSIAEESYPSNQLVMPLPCCVSQVHMDLVEDASLVEICLQLQLPSNYGPAHMYLSYPSLLRFWPSACTSELQVRLSACAPRRVDWDSRALVLGALSLSERSCFSQEFGDNLNWTSPFRTFTCTTLASLVRSKAACKLRGGCFLGLLAEFVVLGASSWYSFKSFNWRGGCILWHLVEFVSFIRQGPRSRAIFKKVAMADESSPHVAPISTKFHSAHVESLKEAMEMLNVNDKQAKVEAEIELSKMHWSELASTYYTAMEGPTMDLSSSLALLPKWINEVGTPTWKQEVAEDNVRVFRSLQEKYPGGFFLDENDMGPDTTQQLPKWMLRVDGTAYSVELGLSSETPFAEGGQAELFHAHVTRMGGGKKNEIFVMKVFKEGMPLRDLVKFFPTTMLANDDTCIEGIFGKSLGNCNLIFGARLVKSTRRFAFVLWKAWGDLRKLINERMLHFNTQGLPFLDDIAFHIIHQIAKGMMELHGKDIIHRDLKTDNILVFGIDAEKQICPVIDQIHLNPLGFHCVVADFECSIGTVGTRFWRAPEILEAMKNRNIFLKPELFSKQADVYSFGMTCYEILSGGMPLKELRANDYDRVIGGARPILPSQTIPWMVDLVNRCWHKDPSMRPPFEEIVGILEGNCTTVLYSFLINVSS